MYGVGGKKRAIFHVRAELTRSMVFWAHLGVTGGDQFVAKDLSAYGVAPEDSSLGQILQLAIFPRLRGLGPQSAIIHRDHAQPM